MSTQTTPFESLISGPARPAGRDALAAVKAVMQRWRRRASTRRQLKQLPPHLYRDVGLRPTQVQREVNLFFWQ